MTIVRKDSRMLIKLNGIRSAEEALEKSGLDWSVDQSEIIGVNGLDISSHKALYRNDNRCVLGVVGKDYVPIQNTTAFAFFDVIAEKFHAKYEFAGIIKGGKKIFLQAKLDKSFEAVRGDRVDCYITMVTSHDGSSSLRAFMTPIRLFCRNQLINAIKSATTNIHLKHTAQVNERIKDAFLVFQMSSSSFDIFKEKAEFLARKIVTKQMVDRFLNELIQDTGSTRAKNQHEKLIDLFENGKGNKGQSAWHLYNAATEYIDHARTCDPEKAMDSAMFGSGSIMKGKAFDIALSL
jgi:phage/plasmid-like protein (TIGR03299 family)